MKNFFWDSEKFFWDFVKNLQCPKNCKKNYMLGHFFFFWDSANFFWDNFRFGTKISHPRKKLKMLKKKINEEMDLDE